MLKYVIIDCYTDEPAGLGVPPYLGTYPRYLYGKYFGKVSYLTIDDIRLWKKTGSKIKRVKISGKSDKKTYNLSKNYAKVEGLLRKAKVLIVILGVHTPGKYLSAEPGTLKEINSLLKDVKTKKVLTGPAVYGTQVEGGKKVELRFEGLVEEDMIGSYDEIKKYALKGVNILDEIDDLRIVEIETSKGCSRKKGCSFCTEPLKSCLEVRKLDDVLKEVEALYKKGVRYFRIGKQSCFYSYPWAIELLKGIRAKCPDIKVLHIDNVNPMMVVSDKGVEITKAIVKYCTSGNVAAFGVESFDPQVISENNLNCVDVDKVIEAIRIINKYGSERGSNGLPKFLPGINLILGLKGESKKTLDLNFKYLKKILDEGLMIRRINIRKVVVFPGTEMSKVGDKFLKQNGKYYFEFRKKLREEIDAKFLERVVPKGNILKNVRMEVYEGKKTFGRQVGTYPLVVGVEGRYGIGKFYDVEVEDYMLRSVKGKVI